MRLWTFAALFFLLANVSLPASAEELDLSNSTDVPTEAPTKEPSTNATQLTTEAPTKEPSTNATQLTTEAPTKEPSTNATQLTTEAPTKEPSTNATQPTEAPTKEPSTPPPVTPAPGSKTWFVNDTGDVCILLKMEAEFRFPVNQTVILPAVAVVAEGSTCNGTSDTQIINLKFDQYYFSLTFVANDTICGSKKFCQNSIIFEDSTTDTNYTGNATDLPLFGAKTGNSYLCKAESKFNLTSGSHVAEVTVRNVQVQAFRTAKTGEFGLQEECVADDHPNDIVPIAVGCALAGLVIIVLIAYLVGRRRNRQKGYQSV